MEPFRTHTGLAVPLDRDDVDTDQIIPKQFLKRIERTGYGDFLFYDWRYLSPGQPRPDFVLNNPRYRGASLDRNCSSDFVHRHPFNLTQL